MSTASTSALSPLVSVRNRIGEASAALERLMTEPFVPDEPDEIGWRMTPELHRFRLLWWLNDLRREETAIRKWSN